MLTFALIGTYLAIGSLIGLFGWIYSDKSEWPVNDPVVSGLTFLRCMVLWPRIFLVIVKVARKRLSK